MPCSGSRAGCHSRNLLQQSANSGIHCFQHSGSAVTSLIEANAGIAQLVEQLICNQQVVGSNPTAGLPVKIPICRGARRSLRNIMRYTSNRARFKISFESRRCCNVREHVAKGSTMFHLVFSFVLVMTQCPASGCSALIGYGGRRTARIVSEETKKSSPIIIATNVFFKTTREWFVFSISHSFYGNGGTKFPKKAERRLSLSSSSPG